MMGYRKGVYEDTRWTKGINYVIRTKEKYNRKEMHTDGEKKLHKQGAQEVIYKHHSGVSSAKSYRGAAWLGQGSGTLGTWHVYFCVVQETRKGVVRCEIRQRIRLVAASGMQIAAGCGVSHYVRPAEPKYSRLVPDVKCVTLWTRPG
jgi:hypothetical protein